MYFSKITRNIQSMYIRKPHVQFVFRGENLTSQTRTLKVSDIVSQLKEVTCSVPQGSILEPILFHFYINN